MAEPEPDEALRRRVASTPLYRELGIALTELDAGRAAAVMVVGPHHCNVDGAVHGGLYGLLADTAMGCAARTGQAPGSQNKTLELGVDFFAGAGVGDCLRAEAVALRRAGRFTWAEATISADVEGGQARTIGRARSLNYEVPPPART